MLVARATDRDLRDALRKDGRAAGRGGVRRGLGEWGRRGGRGLPPAYTFSQAESAAMLPAAAIWISQQGVTQAGTVSAWASYLGGLSCTMSQATGTARPAFNATGGAGGLPLITFDGVDDVLEGPISKGSVWTQHEMGIVGSRVAFGSVSDCMIMMHQSGGFIAGLREQNASALHFTTSTTTAVGSSDPDGVPAFYSGTAQAGEVVIYKNGVPEATTLSGILSTSDASLVAALGGRVAASQYSNFSCQAAVQCGVKLTALQRSYLRQLLTFHTQVNC